MTPDQWASYNKLKNEDEDFLNEIQLKTQEIN